METPVQPTASSDLRSAMTISKTAPEEAAKNIDRAALFDVTPDSYAGLKDQLEPEAIAIERVPATIEPETEKYLRQGEQQASLASNDIDKMNKFEKHVTYAKQKIIDIPELDRDINELVGKKFDTVDGKLDEGDEEMLQDLKSQRRGMVDSAKAYGIGDNEEFAVDVASAVVDFGRMYYENKEILLGAIGTGAAIGGGIGAATPLPGATLVGLTAGATKGAIGGSMVVGFIDAYQQTSSSVYGELEDATNDKGESLNISHEKKVNVSRAVGVLSGIAGGLAGKAFAANNAFMKRFVGKGAAKFATSPAVMAKMNLLGGIAKTAFAEGGEEAFQDFVQTTGTIFGKMDESEASFMNALDEATSAENLKKYAKAGAVGGVTGGVVQTVTSAPGYKGLKQRFEQVDEVTKKKKEVLEAQNNMIELGAIVKETKMNELAPSEMSKFQKNVFASLGVDQDVWVTLEDMREFSKDPEKGAAVRSIIDPTGEFTKMAQELNTPVKVSKADMLKVVTEYPEITNYMRLTPDGENPLAIRNEGKEFAGRLEEAEAKRAAILETMDGLPLTPEQEEELRLSITESVKESKYFNSRESYLGQSAIQPIDGIVNEKDAADLSRAQIEARLEIDKTLVAPVDARFDRYADAEFRTETAQEIQAETEKFQKEYATIENFKKNVDLDEVSNETVSRHKKKGYSAFAVDPKSLPEDLKAIYLENPELKKRKTFVEGGIDIEESAILNGYDSGAQLLKALAETPTRKQIENRIKNDPLRNKVRPEQIEESMEATKRVARDEAFSKLTRAHLKEAELIAANAYSTLKRGIVKIARKARTVEELNTRASETINKMKIRDIHPKMYERGEARTHQQAIKQFTDGQFEQAFESKEKAALNNEMRKEATNSLDKVERYQKFWKKASSESNIQELKDANMFDVMEEFMSLYKLDGSIKGETEQKKFNAFIKKQADEGKFIPAIPDRLDNTQASYKDLTVEQYQTMTEMGQFILSQAKLKNKFLKNKDARNELITAETIAEEVQTKLEAHYNYDPKRSEKKNENHLTPTEKFTEFVRTSISSISSLKTIVSDLDEQKLDGYFHNLIGKPIKDARTAKRTEIAEIETHDKAIIEQFYGMDKFKKMFNEYVSIPEFADIPTLGDGEGNIRKVDLLSLQAHLGDPDGREAILNFTNRAGLPALDVDLLQRVLDTHLDENDVAFTQNFLVDRFKRFEQRSLDLHKKTTGIAPEMVKGVPFVHRGKVYPGGYYPINRQMMSDEMRAGKFLEDFSEKAADLGLSENGAFFARMRSAEMTQQGRLKDRTGSKRPLDIDFENVFNSTEEAVHDLHFRETGIDILKVLKNPMNVKNMKAVVGPKKFAVLLNSVKDTISKSTERESVLFGEEYKWVNKLIQKAHSLHAVKAIGFNFRSAAIQADSLSNLVLRTGPSTSFYLAKTAQKMIANIAHYESFVDMAGEINPDIKFEQDNIDNSVVKHSYDFIPADNTFFKNNKSKGEKYKAIREIQKKGIDASFYFVREADKFNKVLATHALSEKFLNGASDEYPKAKLDTMSEAEKAKALRSYIQQAFDTSLTANATEDKTPLEKNKVASIMVRYWTDRRSRLNSVLAQIDKTKGAYKRGDNAQAIKHVLTMSLALGASSAFVAAVRDEEESIVTQLKGVKNGEDLADVALGQAWNFATAPIDLTLDTIPLVDNIKYQSELQVRSDYRNVSTPLFGVASDMAAGIVILKDSLDMALKGRMKEFSDTQRKLLLTNAGYLAGGAPTNSIYKVFEALNEGSVRKGSKHLKEEIIELHEKIDKYIDVFGDEPERKDFIGELKEYKKELPQFDTDVKNIIPENTKETLKSALSQGKWNKFDPDTKAAGVYQFTEARWNELAATDPSLGLTENGRVSKDPSQQEKAMDWVIQDNTRGLLTYDVPVTEANLLGAHKFGFDNFVAIYESSDKDKLSDALGEDAKNPVFKNFQTVGEIKSYLSRETSKAK